MNAPGLFSSIPARFESDFSLEESVARLRGVVKSSMFSTLFEENAVGKVTEERVVLKHMTPHVGTQGKSFFKGSFSLEHHRAVLTGRFTRPLFLKAFFGIWIGGWVGGTLIGIIAGLNRWAGGWPDGLVWATAFLATATIPFLIIWASQKSAYVDKDVQWLSELITRVLTKSAENVRPRAAASKRDWTMAVVQAVLAVGALGCAVSAATGVAMVQTGMNGGMDIIPHKTWSRLVASIGAIVAVGMLYGVHRRNILGWRVGMIALPTGGLAYLAWILTEGPTANWLAGQRVVVSVIFVVASCLAIAYWTVWWKKQKKYFITEMTDRAGGERRGVSPT